MPQITSNSDGFEKQQADNRTISDQYSRIATAINDFWLAVYQRFEPDQLPWLNDKQGSCRGTPGIDFDDVGSPPVGSKELNDFAVPYDKSGACLYHRLNGGCNLGSLKSIRCLTHSDREEIPDLVRNVIDTGDLDRVLSRGPLFKVLQGRQDEAYSNFKRYPEENEDLVQSTVAQIKAVTDKIKSIPVKNDLQAMPPQIFEKSRIKFRRRKPVD